MTFALDVSTTLSWVLGAERSPKAEATLQRLAGIHFCCCERKNRLRTPSVACALSPGAERDFGFVAAQGGEGLYPADHRGLIPQD